MGGTSVSSRYAGRGKPSQVIIRAPQAGPDRVFVKLTKTVAIDVATGASGAFSNQAISCNDCKDPFGSLGAGGPVGFASWCSNSAGRYLAYCVHAFAIDIEATQPAGTTGTAMCISFQPASGALPTDIVQAAGMPRAKSLLLAAGTQVHRVHAYHSVAEVYGQTNQTVAMDDTFAALYNATPASEVRCNISLQGTSTTLNTLPMLIKLTQYVEFFGRQTDAIPS